MSNICDRGPANPTVLKSSFSLSIAANDNLLLVFEYRMDEDDLTGNETDSVDLEALVTF